MTRSQVYRELRALSALIRNPLMLTVLFADHLPGYPRRRSRGMRRTVGQHVTTIRNRFNAVLIRRRWWPTGSPGPPRWCGLEHWAWDCAVAELLGVSAETLNDDRLGRALDAVASR